MEKSIIERRVYQIIIVFLLVVLAILVLRGQTGHYQISGDKVINTKTGETYVLAKNFDDNPNTDAGWFWTYVGAPKKYYNYEKHTETISRFYGEIEEDKERKLKGYTLELYTTNRNRAAFGEKSGERKKKGEVDIVPQSDMPEEIISK